MSTCSSAEVAKQTFKVVIKKSNCNFLKTFDKSRAQKESCKRLKFGKIEVLLTNKITTEVYSCDTNLIYLTFTCQAYDVIFHNKAAHHQANKHVKILWKRSQSFRQNFRLTC